MPPRRSRASSLLSILLTSALLPGAAAVWLTPLDLGAQGQAPRRRFGPGVCGPIDPAYVRAVTDTGGQLFILGPDEIGGSAVAMDASFDQDPILSVSAAAEQQYRVPLEATLGRVAVLAFFDATGGTLTVTAPDGAPPTGANVRDVSFHCGRIVTIDRPSAGEWQVRAVPSGRFWLGVRARGDAGLIGAEMVRAGGRPGHEGFFPVRGEPIAGRAALLRVSVTELAQPAFALLALDGRRLLEPALDSIDDDEYLGAFDVPPEPFRVAVTGVDARGTRAQRMSPRLFRPQTIEVIANAPDAPARPGFERTVQFTIRNEGPPVRLTLTALHSAVTPVPVSPGSLTLATSAEARASVLVAVPTDAQPFATIDVMLTAYDNNPESPRGNYAVATVHVSDSR